MIPKGIFQQAEIPKDIKSENFRLLNLVCFDQKPWTNPLEKSLFLDAREIIFLKAYNRISVTGNVP